MDLKLLLDYQLYMKSKIAAEISDLLDIDIVRVQQIIEEYEKNK